MNPLKLPEQLSGPWEHVLILTYGADIPFFESALWREFGGRCRNKIILADGRQFLDACEVYAQSGLIRYLNQRYVVEGVFLPHAAHAKLILMVNSEQGRLLVGSGNLGWQGYASGGELFTQYDYSADTPEALPAFLSAWDLVDGLMAHGYVGATTTRHLQHLREGALWLSNTSRTAWSPLRHNLTQSFLTQLQGEVKKESVEELWILAPFLDKEAIALERLLDAFKPQTATLLVQPGYTSADPTVLQNVLRRFRRLQVKPCRLRGDDAYVHAKLYLLKLKKRAICLQGSPNLSQVAMLRAGPDDANIELANLLIGKPDAFDDLLATLEVQPATKKLDTLDISYQTPRSTLKSDPDEWRFPLCHNE